MIVTGPNGCGKSTMLDGLRNAPGPRGPILYVGPHRTSGRQTVRMRYLHQKKVSIRQLQSGANLPSFEGVNIHSRNRSAWDFDETSSYLKYALCQIELDRQTALTERFDKHGEIAKGAMPDVWKPLREMTENLLPHLHFDKIDVSNRDQVKCQWTVHTKNIQVDIDDLSSGEKAIIQLFFPLVENRIQARIERCKGGEARPEEGKPTEEVCVLMDEPELHLHPNLQGKILDYLRNLAVRERVQFILATHSPTIVEHASSDELYLLRPSEMVGVDDNQLSRIATDNDRLNLMRDVFGSTSNITAMRNILVVEGRKSDNRSRRASDERILSFLSDRFAQLTIRSGGGKDQCKSLAQSLTDILSDELSLQLRAYALVDRDLEEGEPDESNVQFLPVSMIENFLVDPEVLWNAIVTVRHKTKFSAQKDVEKALDTILDTLGEHELGRRIKAGVGFHAFRLHDPISEASEQARTHIITIKEAVSNTSIASLTKQAEDEIKKLRDKRKRRENYDGKRILDEFYARHLQDTGMSKEIFIYECARRAANRKSVSTFVDDLFEKFG